MLVDLEKDEECEWKPARKIKTKCGLCGYIDINQALALGRL
jgi:hypothetical protein